jgi:hypothetical protein
MTYFSTTVQLLIVHAMINRHMPSLMIVHVSLLSYFCWSRRPHFRWPHFRSIKSPWPHEPSVLEPDLRVRPCLHIGIPPLPGCCHFQIGVGLGALDEPDAIIYRRSEGPRAWEQRHWMLTNSDLRAATSTISHICGSVDQIEQESEVELGSLCERRVIVLDPAMMSYDGSTRYGPRYLALLA